MLTVRRPTPIKQVKINMISMALLLGGLLLIPPVVSQAGLLELTGSFTQGGLIMGRTEPGARITLDGQPVRVSPTGAFVIGFDRDAPAGARLETTFRNGSREQRTLTIKPRRYQVQRISGLPEEKVTPPPEVMGRIQREKAQLQEARSRDIDTAYFLSGFTWPVNGRISGIFGSQRILNGEPRQPHYAIDIAATAGTPVKAPADGVVTLAQPDLYFTGGTLIVDHGYGLSSLFAHLQEIYVRPGQTVKQGQTIAAVGATGRAAGPHLHWGLNWLNRHLDPALLLMPPH
ncbi:MAG: M23 family metallopeptidase [Candidatus Competibacteraceae bacterium]